MVLGSHNAWSYLPTRKWWMKPLAFTAKCQKYDIQTQYEKYNSRCFDLRLTFDDDSNPIVVHNLMQYKITKDQLIQDLQWLNSKGDVYVRVLLDIRSKRKYTNHQVECFKQWCEWAQNEYRNIIFICGRNLYNWEVEYDFGNNVAVEELYSSVTSPYIIDDWFPLIYAKLHNKDNIQKGTDKQILLIDFVNIQ